MGSPGDGFYDLLNEAELAGVRPAFIVTRDLEELHKIWGENGHIGWTTEDGRVYVHNGTTWIYRPEMQHILFNKPGLDEWGLPDGRD